MVGSNHSQFRKALIIYGSPRIRESASYHIGEYFSRGLNKAGTIVEEIFLAKKKINHCIGCYTCWTKTPGKCAQVDDMAEIVQKIQGADLIVLATPLYTFSVPGIVKDFLDRTIPLIEPYLVKRDGITQHPSRNPSKKLKFFVISVAGFPERSHFDPLVKMFQKIYKERLIGQILISGSEMISKDEFQQAFVDLYDKIEVAGYELSKTGIISEAAQNAIAEENSFSDQQIDEFIKMSNDYWNTFFKSKNQEIEIVNIENKPLEITDKGLSSFFAGMAKTYNPEAISNLNAVIQFELEDQFYYLIIKDKKCSAYKGINPKPNLTIITTTDTWMKISTGELDGVKALKDGQYKTEGDLSLMMNMHQLFSTSNNDTLISKLKLKEKSISKGNNRGTMKVSSSLWFTIAFFPWILLWVLGSIPFIEGYISRIIALVISTLIISYHAITNIPTLWEKATFLYLLLASILFLSGWEFFIEYAIVIDYIFLGGLWLGSTLNRFCISAEYTKFEYPEIVWTMPAFTRTNDIITGTWGMYYLAIAILDLLSLTLIESTVIFTVIRYTSLIPMFIFTGWFQKWYSSKMLEP